jgi:hypothetical protein
MHSIEHPHKLPMKWGAVASLGFHVAFAAMLLLLPKPQPFELPRDDGISVEILTPPPAPQQPKPEPDADRPNGRSAKPPSDEARATPSLPDAAGMIRPTRLLSEATLADPRSRAARAELGSLGGSERIVQLCNVEAMDQVHAWKGEFRPDRVVAYAMAAMKIEGDTIAADGAAFRSNSAWYRLRFKCAVTADHRKVASFEFLVGDAIPASQWEAHDLPAIH